MNPALLSSLLAIFLFACSTTAPTVEEDAILSNEVEGAGVADEVEQKEDPTQGDAEVQGTLSRDVIQEIVRGSRDEVATCYSKELESSPELSGRIIISWVISPLGEVISATVAETTMDNRNVEECVTRTIRGLIFPEPDGGGIVRVNYPFNFSN